ncbi:hypothetical protein EDEG_03056 [Edhazardia aedis USNM 41457]|uniref:Deacetylase sirtuin-type domain-containing protein n=1 Tax=Edhazardia aedis (strain USNM 41457) TaxID=1003232 RepID=J9D4T9_EDHAE|nr:hypothetical protein EDEG_03056 [Edhazardia aedis USNM 41457]|eukprot:EJW02544.1 hypothetical protein EDEG_03056 [Edhazardia aedis USNM 41457]
MKATKDKKTDVVYMHGTLRDLVCIVCGFKVEFTAFLAKELESGEDITCKNCLEIYKKREISKLRPNRIGYMNTSIIHYDQIHPDGHFIGELFYKDISKTNLFIVIGTSLKVYGIKEFVKKGLRNCINNNGKSVFVGLEEPSKEFRELFDYFWKGDCDDFVRAVAESIEVADINESLINLSIHEDLYRNLPRRSSKKNEEIRDISQKTAILSIETNEITVKKMVRKIEIKCNRSVESLKKIQKPQSTM